jgi:hypothetical protein
MPRHGVSGFGSALLSSDLFMAERPEMPTLVARCRLRWRHVALREPGLGALLREAAEQRADHRVVQARDHLSNR